MSGCAVRYSAAISPIRASCSGLNTTAGVEACAVETKNMYVVTNKELNAVGFIGNSQVIIGGSLDIENYCTLRPFFDLSTLVGLSRRNLPEAGIRLLFHI
ncbi:hypothetical protein D3C80_1425980 [compost metagenome]